MQLKSLTVAVIAVEDEVEDKVLLGVLIEIMSHSLEFLWI